MIDKRPGIMVYFEAYGPMQLLPDAERGQLISAILEYGMDGTVPQFRGNLAIAWGFIRPKIDRDAEAYRIKVIGNRYATYCRLAKARGQQPINRDVWMSVSDDDRDRLMAGDIIRYPTADTTVPAAATVSVTTAVSAATDAINDDTTSTRYAAELMEMYPAHRRGDPDDVRAAVRAVLRNDGDCAVATANLAAWIGSAEWHKDDGRYIPSMTKWLRNGLWRITPKGGIARGYGQRELDEDELTAIERLFAAEGDRVED